MKKNIFGQYIITEEEKEEIQYLKTAMQDKQKSIEDRDNVIKRRNTRIQELKDLVFSLESQLKESASNIRKEFSAILKEKDEKIQELTKDKNSFASRCGGYQKEQNKNHRQIDSLKSELDKKNAQICNYQKFLKEEHVPISPKEYDNRIITVAKHRKKLNKGK